VSSTKERDIARQLAEREGLDPPAGLLERIKSEIPAAIQLGAAAPGDEPRGSRGAGESRQRRRQHECQQLVAIDRVAQRDRARLVLADRLQYLAERRMHDATQEQEDRDEYRQHEVIHAGIRLQRDEPEHAPARHAADSERDVEREGAGGDRIAVHARARIPHAHHGPLAELPLDLGQGTLQGGLTLGIGLGVRRADGCAFLVLAHALGLLVSLRV